ncbi:vWA domain-containing protein [Streptomyces sp. YKOK-I1]
MNGAVAVGVPRGRLPLLAAEGARFAVRLAEAEFGGSGAGVWLFGRDPVRIPSPGPEGLAPWASEWLDEGTAAERLRGEPKDNALRRLKQTDALGDGLALRLAPALEAVLDASAHLQGHTVAVILLTEAPGDDAAFMATMRRAARLPVFWVFIGAEASVERVAPLGVVDALGREPGDPDNCVVLKVGNWSSATRWLTSRRIRRAVGRWRRATSTG